MPFIAPRPTVISDLRARAGVFAGIHWDLGRLKGSLAQKFRRLRELSKEGAYLLHGQGRKGS